MNCLAVGEIQVIGAARLDKALRNSPLTLRIHHLTPRTLSSSRPFSGFAETSDAVQTRCWRDLDKIAASRPATCLMQ